VPNFTLNSGTTAEKLAKTIRGLLFFAAPCIWRNNSVWYGCYTLGKIWKDL